MRRSTTLRNRLLSRLLRRRNRRRLRRRRRRFVRVKDLRGSTRVLGVLGSECRARFLNDCYIVDLSSVQIYCYVTLSPFFFYIFFFFLNVLGRLSATAFVRRHYHNMFMYAYVRTTRVRILLRRYVRVRIITRERRVFVPVPPKSVTLGGGRTRERAKSTRTGLRESGSSAPRRISGPTSSGARHSPCLSPRSRDGPSSIPVGKFEKYKHRVSRLQKPS